MNHLRRTLVFLFLCACSPSAYHHANQHEVDTGGSPPSPESPEAERTAEKNTADARVDASKAEAEALQNEQESGYQVLLNEAIANLENRIKLLKVKVQSRKGEARKTMDTAIVDLEARRLELETESNKLRTSSELDWEATKGRIEQLLESSGKLLAAPFD